MHYLAIGVAGFLIIHISDPAAIKKLPVIKPLAWFVGMALLLFSLAEMCLAPSKLLLPDWSAWIAWPLVVMSAAMITYSLFVSLPFVKTYVAAGSKGRLVTTGFYSLVRHPWVHWHVLLMVALTLGSKSLLMAYAALLFTVLDVAAVSVQDHIFFPRMFAGYSEYRRHTPMLVPTRKSVKAFLDWLHPSRQMQPVSVVSKQKEATHVHLS